MLTIIVVIQNPSNSKFAMTRETGEIKLKAERSKLKAERDGRRGTEDGGRKWGIARSQKLKAKS
jgi:hypothetical protein